MFKFLGVLIVLIYFHISSAEDTDDVIVQLSNGKVLGTVERSANGTEYYAYYQIPYATPPINDYRFKEPQDPKTWDDILNATVHTKACPQAATGIEGLVYTEDCLYLSVNTPTKPGNDNALPVLVWIHGGGFTTGSISHYSPKYLMDYDIIVVQIQYRLGPFGFLTTMDGVIPANLGLKDQKTAINWVYNNIRYFGGDPNKITVMGESAGAMSIGYLLLDQTLIGKIRGAIQQSGSSGQRSINVINARNNAFNIGSIVDSNFNAENSSHQLLEVLQKRSADEIISASETFQTMMVTTEKQSTGLTSERLWGIVMEDAEVENDPIVTSPVLRSFQNGDFVRVPTIISFNSEEALLTALSATDEQKKIGKEYDDNPSLMADKRFSIPAENATEFGIEQIKLYTNSSFEEDYGALVRYTTDSGMVNGILAQATFSAAHTPVYCYQFSYAGENLGTLMYQIIGLNRTSIPGAESVTHSEDLNYVWYWPFYYNPDVPDSDLATRKILLKLITNFVKYLNGTPEEYEELDNIIWPTVTSGSEIQYLNINKTLEIKSNPRNFKKISDLYEKYVGINNVW